MSLDWVHSLLGEVAELKPEFVFCHCALGKLGLPLTGATQLIAALVEVLGTRSTLVMPSFPYATNAEYAAYLAGPLDFDAGRTPARVNLPGELLRRRPEARRSLVPIYPLAAVGPDAEELVAEDHLESMPFAARTAFAKLAERRTVLLGLGVDINTCAFVHLIDDPFVDRLGLPIYPPEPVKARLYRNGEFVTEGAYSYVTPEARRGIRPARLHPLLASQSWYRHCNEPYPCYVLPVGDFVCFGRELVAGDLARGVLPAWHVPSPSEAAPSRRVA